MKKILILAFSDLRHDARIARQIEFLKNEYSLTVICKETNGAPGFEAIIGQNVKLSLWRKGIVAMMLALRMYSAAHRFLYDYSEVKRKLGARPFDLVIANDIESLPFAFDYAPAKVLFDAHEYAPRHFEDKRMWRIFFQPMNIFLCKKYIPRTSAMTTVGRALAEEYEKHFGVRPVVITNACPFVQSTAKPLRDGKVRMIHHGGANPSRQLELMINMVRHLDDKYSLDLMLITPTVANKKTRSYLDELKALAANTPGVRILPPVKSSEIVDVISRYDMGVFLIPPVNFNYANTLPNKLFDFIQARLAIAIGPTPEMAEIVNDYKIGVVSREFSAESLAAELKKLTSEDINRFKSNTEKAAHDLNAGVNQKILLELVRGIIR
jgi:glycosyltransferase involved in cell wall biosynthesis